MNYNEAHHYLNSEIGVTNGLKMLSLLADNKVDEGINFIKELTQCDDNIAQKLWLDLKDRHGTSKTNSFIKEKEERKIQQPIQDKPKCPTCNSTNVKPISGLNRGASIAIFGVFSKKINKSFECKNCGYTW